MSAHGQQARWLAIVGIGEDGAEGLSPAARALIANAKLVIGGKRHLALADGLPSGERKAWPSPIAASIPAILAHRGEPVAVLASGDPYCFGVGAMLSAHVPAEETICVPAPSSLSLGLRAARLGARRCCRGVALRQADRDSCAGAPAEAPRARALRRRDHPAAVARYLSARGFEQSTLHVLEALGWPARARAQHHRRSFWLQRCRGAEPDRHRGRGKRPAPRSSRFAQACPTSMFEHDGQITKREIRAVTLSSLSASCRRVAVGHRLRLWLHRHRVAAAASREPRHRHRARSAARRPRRAQRRRAWRASVRSRRPARLKPHSMSCQRQTPSSSAEEGSLR